MEESLLSRLQERIKPIEELSNECHTLNLVDLTDENRTKAVKATSKLESFLQKLTCDLNTYFQYSTVSNPDAISEITQIQLTAENNLLDLQLKIKACNNLETSLSASQAHTKLPKLNLPEFNGNILEWQSFWDHFNSNIHSRNISDVDKLLYLKASLVGDAKKSIEGLESTNLNYSIAVTTLKERYGKRDHIIDAHYSALYKIKPSDKSAEDCRKTLNEIERHIRVLNGEHKRVKILL